MKKIIAVLFMIFGFSNVSHAETIKIGMIDTMLTNSVFGHNTKIIKKNFIDQKDTDPWMLNDKISHGDAVAYTIIQTIRNKTNDDIEIYAANPMKYMTNTATKSEGLKKALMLDANIAIESLDWFHENNVKIVVTTFVGYKKPMFEKIANRAKELGITLFVSAGNTNGNMIYPATIDGVITVASTGKVSAFKHIEEVANATKFMADGSLVYKLKKIDEGSSYAVAKVAAIAATIQSDDVVKALNDMSERKDYNMENGKTYNKAFIS